MANFQPSKAEAVAREDWIEDSQGYFELNYERFAASWFQLADLWTDHISVECYYVFLHQTLECLAPTAAPSACLSITLLVTPKDSIMVGSC